MKVTREKAVQNRAKIVQAASRLFREQGFDGVGVDAIMQAAGLTHGGFYNHFRSKDELVAEAMGSGFSEGEQTVAAQTSLDAFASMYLSPEHRDDRCGGCTLAALAGDIGRHQAPGARRELTRYVRAMITRLGELWPGRQTAARRRQRSVENLCTLVGALVLARAVGDPELSNEILATGRAGLEARSGKA